MSIKCTIIGLHCFFCNWFKDRKVFRRRSFLRALQVQKFSIGRNHKTKRSLLISTFADLSRADPLSLMPAYTIHLYKAADQRWVMLKSDFQVSNALFREHYLKRAFYHLYFAPLWYQPRLPNAFCPLIQMSITVQKAYRVPSSPSLHPQILSAQLTSLTVHTHFVLKYGFWRFSFYFHAPKHHFLSMGKKILQQPLFCWMRSWQMGTTYIFFQILNILTPDWKSK